MKPRARQAGSAPAAAGVAVAVCVLVAAWPAFAGEKAVLLPIDGTGLLPAVRDEIDVALRDALERTGLDVDSPETTADLLSDAHAGGLSCNFAEAPCAAHLGAIAGVPVVLIALVAGNDPMTLRLARVDVGRAAISAAAVDTFVLPDKALKLRAMAERVAHPLAVVTIDAAPLGAVVTVDKLTVGTAPLPPLSLAPGSHDVKVEADGYLPSTKPLRLLAGARVELPMHLEKPALPAPLVPAATKPAPSPATTTATPPTTTAPAEPEKPRGSDSPLLAAGAVTFLASGIVAGVCGIGVISVEDDLATPRHGGHDPSEKTLGLALIGGTVVAGIGAAVGATLVGLAFVE